MLNTKIIAVLKHRLKTMSAKTKRGTIMPVFVIICLIGVIVLISALSEYNNILIVRNLEAAADLAAVESLRKYIAEDALRNERLEIKEEDLPKIRDLFLEKVKTHMPEGSMQIIRVEIPTVKDGEIIIPENFETADFPYSTSTDFVDYGSQQNDTQQWYLLGGNTVANSSVAIVRDTSNIDTASKKSRTSYIMTAKVTIIYETIGLLNNADYNLLNYVDVFTDNPVSIETHQVNDKRVNCITVECEGKVTLR